MKRLAASLSALFVFSVTALAHASDVPDVAGCRGVLTPRIVKQVHAATEDPAASFAKEHRRTAAVPKSVRCASKLWQSIHAETVYTRDISPLHRAPQTDRDRKQVVRAEGNGNGNGNAFGHLKDHGKPDVIAIKRAESSKIDLRALPQDAPDKIELPEREEPEITPVPIQPGDDDVVFGSALKPHVNAQPAPPAIMNFAGLDFQNFGNGHPPDTNGDVGTDYFIQTINTSIGIFRKSDGVRVAAFSFNTFMSQGHFGNLCDTNNFGDPVVLYDSFEDRWIITDFAFRLAVIGGVQTVVNPPGTFQCIAASMSGDPVSGGWNYYSINVAGGLGDYPKFGIWPDGLYMSANMFPFATNGAFLNVRAYAFNKAQMYAGSPTVQVVSFNLTSGDFTVLPANARLQTGTPPPGSPNYYVSTQQFLDGVGVYKFHVDWNDTALSTFTGPVAVFNTFGARPNAGAAAAPSLGGNNLDTLPTRAMMQNQYTNLGGAESVWVAHTVRRQNTTGFAAPRYYQVDVSGGNVAATTTQGTTWDPDGANVIHRFIPSLAVDRAGDMALGYSTSSSTTKPAIKYAGRLSTDPVNTFSQTEQVLIQGTGTQLGNCGGAPCTRWGDYSAMTLDPDGCTFWDTSMYYAVDGLNHQTRIGSFRFAPCTPVGGGGSISGTVTTAPGGAPLGGATVTLGSRVATTNVSGSYAFLGLPAGTYSSLTVTSPGYNTGAAFAVVVTDGNTTTQNFALSAGATNACLTDTTQGDFAAGIPTRVSTAASPGDVVLNRPAVEQNPNATGSGVGVNSATWGGQVFTAPTTGPLTRADVDLFCSGCTGTTPNLTISIRATAGTPELPVGPDLATATIPGFATNTGGFFTATFGTPAVVTAGTRYAVILHAVTNPSAGTYAWIFNGTNPYPNGHRVTSGNSGATWTADTTRDLVFKVFVDAYELSGNVVSTRKDSNPPAGASPVWSTISWNAAEPAGTTIKTQVAASNSVTGPFNFVGPDGTSATFFSSGDWLSQFNGNRYLRYAAFFTSNGSATPALNDVTICYIDTLPAVLGVAPASGTYGGTATLSATLAPTGNPVGGKTIAFTIDGSSVGTAITDATGLATLNVSLGARGAGPHLIGASFAGDSAYSAATGSAALTINKAVLTVTANNVSRLYGYPNPPLTASYSGFQGADTFASSVTGSPALSTTATQFSANGTYPITVTAGTLAANNYSFTFVDGTLTIELSGLIGLNSVSFGGSKAFADSFDSSGGYPATQGSGATVLSNGPIDITGRIAGSVISTQSSVQLQPSAIVEGNVVAGTTVSNKGTVLGSISQNQSAAALAAAAVPDCGAFTLNPDISGNFSYSNGDLKVSGGSTATLADGSYCFHSITLAGGAVLQVTGPVSINLTGALNATGGAFVNTTRIPARLQIASSYAGSGGVAINGGADAFLTVYAPKTDVTITGTSSFFGAALGKTLTVSGNPDVHYDTALPNIWGAFFGF